MNGFLLSALIGSCLLIVGWGLAKRQRLIQYPFLIAVVYLGWVVPQLIGLSMAPPYDLPTGALAKTILMALLCLIALFYGYTLNKAPTRLFWWKFSETRLIWCAAGLSLFGTYFFFKVMALAEAASAQYGGAWSGTITIYYFLSRTLTIGMVIALVLHFIRPRRITFAIVAFDLLFYLNRIIVQGRRAAMVELTLMLLMALWFQRRWLPPRWTIVTVMIAGTLMINSIGDYRRTMTSADRVSWTGSDLSEIANIDFIGNLKGIATGERKSEELRNAIMNIEAADQIGAFDFGLSLWNSFVTAYVPGQWVGPSLKRSMTLDFENDSTAYFHYVPYPGSTLTGFSDAFLSFWYFGAIKFLLAGLIMSRWYQAAVRGNIVAQMVLMLVITDSLQLITHSTSGFFLGFVDLAAFLLPALVFSRVKPRRSDVPGRARNQHMPVSRA